MSKHKALGPFAAAALIAMPVIVLLAAQWDWAAEKVQRHPGWTWAVMVLLLVTMFALLGVQKVGRWEGILIDETNRMSLSRLQAVLWATILVSGIAAAFAINFARECHVAVEGKPPQAGACVQSPWNLQIPNDVLILAGISAATLGFATAVNDANQRKKPKSEPAVIRHGPSDRSSLTTAKRFGVKHFGVVVGSELPEQASWSQLIDGDTIKNSEHLDLARLQQLVFVVVLAGTYAVSFLYGLGGSPARAVQFPGFESTLNVLLFVSGATYVGLKALDGSAAGE